MALSDSILGAAGQYRQMRQSQMSMLGQAGLATQQAGNSAMLSVQQFQQQLKVADFQAVRQRASLNATKFAQMEQQELRGQAITWGAANPDAPLTQVPVHLQPFVNDAFDAQRVMRGEKRVADEDREKDALAAEKAAQEKRDAEWRASYLPIMAEDPKKVPKEAWATAPKDLADNIIAATGTERRFGARQDILAEDAAAFALLDAADTEEELLAIDPSQLTPKASAERERRVRARRMEKDRATDNARADMLAKDLMEMRDSGEKGRKFDDAMKMIQTSFSEYRRQFGGGVDMARWAANAAPAMRALYDSAKKYAVTVGRDLDAEVGAPTEVQDPGKVRMRELLKKGAARTPEEDAEFLDLTGGR